MPKARSYKNEPWAGFERQSYTLLKDDFVHEKLLTVKTNVDSARGGVNLKQTLNQKGDTMTSTGQTKLWFYFRNNLSLYTKIQPNAITLQYDHGILQRNNNFFNWYGGLETNRNLNNNLWRVGLDVFAGTGKWMCNNMLQFNQNDHSLYWFHKAYTNNGNWFFNNYNTINLTGKAVTQSAFLIALRNVGATNNEYFARFQLDGFSNSQEFKRSIWYGNKVTLNWINTLKGRYAHGVEFSSKLNELSQVHTNLLSRLATAFEFRLPEQNSTVKLRISGNWAAALSVKHSLGSYGTYTWGVELNQIGTKNNARFGVQIDLNV